MKKFFLIAIFSIVGLFQTNAQEIGIRFGEMTGNNVAIDGIFSLGEFSRIHANLSFGDDGVGTDALYDFLNEPLGDGFNWYIGAGPLLFITGPFYLIVSGEIGI